MRRGSEGVLAEKPDKRGLGGKERRMARRRGVVMRRHAPGFILFPAHEHICSTKASLGSRLSVDKCLLATGSRNDKHPEPRKLFEVYYRNNRNDSTKPSAGGGWKAASQREDHNSAKIQRIGVCEGAQRAKELAAKPGDLNVIPGSHMVLQQVVL